MPYRGYLGFFVRLFLSSLVRGGLDGKIQSFLYKNIAFPEQGKYSYFLVLLGCKYSCEYSKGHSRENFLTFTFFLKSLPLKDDELVMSEM